MCTSWYAGEAVKQMFVISVDCMDLDLCHRAREQIEEARGSAPKLMPISFFCACLYPFFEHVIQTVQPATHAPAAASRPPHITHIYVHQNTHTQFPRQAHP